MRGAQQGEEHNTYLSREKLEEMGWGKMVQRMDQQEALRAGTFAPVQSAQQID